MGKINSIFEKISFKLSRIVLLVALLLGFALSFVQIYWDFTRADDRLFLDIQQILAVALPPATRAAHLLDNELAIEVVNGIMEYDFIDQAIIYDDLNNILAAKNKTPRKSSTQWITKIISTNSSDFVKNLSLSSNKTKEIGKMVVTVNQNQGLASFYNRALIVFVSGIIRNLILAILLLIIFQILITQPVVSIIKSFSEMNPGNLKDATIKINKKNERNELGLLVKTINRFINSHKDAERSLRESEKKHREQLERLNDAAYRMSIPDGIYEYFSPAAKIVFGYDSKQWINNSKLIAEIIHPDFINYFEEKWAELILGKVSKSYEYKIIDPKGNERWIFQSNTGIFNNQGEIIGIEGLCRNITDRKLAEEALKDNQKFLDSIIEQSPYPTWISDTKGTMIRANPALKEVLNLSDEQLIGNYNVFNDEQIEPDILRKIHDVLEKGITSDYELDWVGNKTGIDGIEEGNRVYCEGTVFPIYNQIGKITHAVITYKDVTDRKNAEEALQDSEEQYRAVADNIGDYIMRYNKECRHIYANRAALEATGLPIEEYIGKNHHEMGFPEHLCELWGKNIQLVFDTGKQQNIEFDVELAEGIMSLELQLNPEFAMNGSIRSVIGISRDITERKKMEARLLQAQKMESIGTLAGGIAHDFNNLLYPIIGFAEMLKEDLPQDSPEHDSAQEIFNAGRRGGELVKQILAFSRQSDHKLSPVRFQKILTEVCKLTRSTIPSDIEIHQDIQKDCGLVMAEATQLHQIAMNLITNAYHAVEKTSGKISIQLKEILLDKDGLEDSPLQPGQYGMLSVSDNGVGIPRKIMNNIFEPYFTTKEKGKGTGLGLAVVYGILTEHKGDIKVYSEEGKGTTFNVYLPLMKKSDETFSTEKVLNKLTGTEKILLVDDDESVVRLEKQMLERLGYSVSALSNSLEALETFNSNPDGYDLVISDMTMPNMTGDQLARELMSIRPDIPVIICTGFSERINKEQAEANKVKGFLMKPVVKSEMAQMVRKVLDEV